MPGPDDADLAGFAGEIQKLAGAGGFDPFAMFSAAQGFHSVFLAPFSPALTTARSRFLEHGDGPLSGAVEALRTQASLSCEDALARARSMFQAAQGMCVVVLAGEQGVATIPQLFFGHLSPEWCQHAVAACGSDFPAKEPLARALQELGASALQGRTWPSLVAGPERGTDLLGYWLDLASGVVSSQEQLLRPGADRLGDLGHWVAEAVALLAPGTALDSDDLQALAQCRIAASEWLPAATLIEQAIACGLADDDLVELITHWSGCAARLGAGHAAATWLDGRIPAFEERLGPSYDLARAVVALLAAAMAPAAELIPAAERLIARDRKSARHDLTREPLWAVVRSDPGELLDTVQAAALINRSTTFVARRLEQGTLPSHRQGEVLRIPKDALLAWKAVLDRFQLLDG